MDNHCETSFMIRNGKLSCWPKTKLILVRNRKFCFGLQDKVGARKAACSRALPLSIYNLK